MHVTPSKWVTCFQDVVEEVTVMMEVDHITGVSLDKPAINLSYKDAGNSDE